ncbi:hypothetical protein NGB36_29080 [Streptomyces sp. RB6PN25]|uniref:Uncharacterized protein n=1 Tax=Streptomyces humicola TaxID=2953240 RepID=A0ABT1Q582_9ACTN|nr:hypothetical protein [Streptomyces humicola]MCQ4084518.1 hypothetical protein [Streptomyces humicola]
MVTLPRNVPDTTGVLDALNRAVNTAASDGDRILTFVLASSRDLIFSRADAETLP